jgi:hypothetical protein
MDVVCIALGGLGSSFDQLAMNRELLVKHNVRLRGVILNKVNPAKMDMIQVRRPSRSLVQAVFIWSLFL